MIFKDYTGDQSSIAQYKYKTRLQKLINVNILLE